MKKLRRFLAPIAALWLLPSCLSVAADFNVVGSNMFRILQNGHYARLPSDENLSQRIFDGFIRDLDPARLYFEKGDIDEFQKKYGRKLHDLLLNEESIPAASQIYGRYRQRVNERIAVVKSLLENGDFTFKSDREIMQDREDAPWPKDSAEATEIWRLRLEESLLGESLRREGIAKRAKEQGKDNPLEKEISPEKKIAQRYERFLKTITKTDEEDVANYFLSAVARAHDPHSEYFSARELQEFKVSIKNKLVGIGAMLRTEDDGATKIDGIVNNGPADRQGDLQLKDRVVAVDSLNDGKWVDIMFLPIDKVVEKIRGKEGTDVALKVEPADGAPGETRVIVIRREVVTMKDELATAEVFSYGEEDTSKKLGVVKLPSFYFDPENRDIRVSVDLEKLLNRLNKEKIDGLVMDLRGNGGGSLEEVRRITSFFVGRGPVVQIKATSGHVESLGSNALRKPIYDGPMVVLTGKGSASASEILAGALQDYNRAVIVGESSTFGKGTVQQPLEIARFMPLFADHDRAGAVKLTIQKFYRVAGSSTQKEGVIPDIVFPSVRDALEVGERYADHALPHDTIKQAVDFRPFNRQSLFLSVLQEKNEVRVKASKDFNYVFEDKKRVEERLKKNTVSLNIEKRRAEIAENDLRRKARNTERLKRFEIQEKQDKKKFMIYRMTLDDIEKPELPQVDREGDKEWHMRRAKDEIADLDDTPEWPSGLDVTKREGLAVLGDLVDAVKASKIAGVLRKD